MNLKFGHAHISISSFEPVTIGDFTVLTGLNGAGKTHFLDAIKTGAIIVEEISKSEIVYYNYNDFTIFTGNQQESKEIQLRIANRKKDIKETLDEINQLKNKVINIVRKEKSRFDSVLCGFIEMPNYNFQAWFGIETDYEQFDILKAQDGNLKDNLSKTGGKFSRFFFDLIQKLAKEGDIRDQINATSLEKKFKALEQEYFQAFNTERPELYDFILAKNNDISLFSLNEHHFESANFVLEDIANEERDYQLKRANNIFDQVSSEHWDSKAPFLSKEEFLTQNGKSPIEQLNDVLTEYDCNGYLLSTNDFRPKLGTDRSNMKIQVILKHSTHGYVTTLDKLSSGEKTLITLSLLIYKLQKTKISPRLLLLDEIDSSLHPSMIQRIIHVINTIFIAKHKLKIILATHSPTTVALSPEDSIYVINREKNKKLTQEKKSVAITQLTEGFVTLDEKQTNLGIRYNISNTLLPVLFTEGITDKMILEVAWNKLYSNVSMPFYVQDCFDASFLRNFLLRGYNSEKQQFLDYPDQKFISLFDFDSEGYNAWAQLKFMSDHSELNPFKTLTRKTPNSKLYALLLPVPNSDVKNQIISSGNETFKEKSILTIEHLLYEFGDTSKHFIKQSIAGGGQIIQFKSDKIKFAEENKTMPDEHFVNFIPLFDKVKQIIDN